MKPVFRMTLALSLLAAFVAAAVPFTSPLDVSFDIDQPPAWIPLVGLAAIVGIPLGLISAGGLFFFKPWARRLGLVTGLYMTGMGCVLAVASPLLKLLAPTAIFLYVVSALTWFWCLALAKSRLSGTFSP